MIRVSSWRNYYPVMSSRWALNSWLTRTGNFYSSTAKLPGLKNGRLWLTKPWPFLHGFSSSGQRRRRRVTATVKMQFSTFSRKVGGCRWIKGKEPLEKKGEGRKAAFQALTNWSDVVDKDVRTVCLGLNKTETKSCLFANATPFPSLKQSRKENTRLPSSPIARDVTINRDVRRSRVSQCVLVAKHDAPVEGFQLGDPSDLLIAIRSSNYVAVLVAMRYGDRDSLTTRYRSRRRRRVQR